MAHIDGKSISLIFWFVLKPYFARPLKCNLCSYRYLAKIGLPFYKYNVKDIKIEEFWDKIKLWINKGYIIYFEIKPENSETKTSTFYKIDDFQEFKLKNKLEK